MKKQFVVFLSLALFLLGCITFKIYRGEHHPLRENYSYEETRVMKKNEKKNGIYITSPVFPHRGKIPQKYSCDGEGINPPLEIFNVPVEAESLVLIMWDPDVPEKFGTGGIWDHWLIYNLDPHTREIEEGKEPNAQYGITTSKTFSYVPPCPPDREHRYFFDIYALDTKLDLPDGVTKDTLLKAMQGHVIDSHRLEGRYERRSS